MKGYYLYPDIKDDKIAFTSDDDIWIFQNNEAKRLTSGLGVSIRPKFSPDGNKVAFTVLWYQNGSSGGDIYVSDGNESWRVTYFNSPNSRVALWTSNNEIIVITDYHTPFSTIAYKVNIENGETKRLDFGILSNITIKDNIIVLARGYQDLPFWKGYRGGTKGELWISLDNGKKFEKFVSLDGTVSWPMIINDRVYFLSDHEGIGNLYSVNLKGEDLRKHTNLPNYCRNANSDGKKIVFQNTGDIYLFDPSNEKLEKLDINIITDRKKRLPKFVNVLDYLTETDLREDYISLVSRGKIFVMKPWDGPAVQLGDKQGVRYSKHQLLPDGSVIVSDDEDNLLLLSASNKKLLRGDLGRIEKIKLSPDGKKVLISNNKLELWLYDIDNNTLKLVDKSDYGLLNDFDWHPNGEWFAYSFPEGHYTRSIKIANINGNTTRITSPYGYDFSPSFDPDGRYLYFLSARHLEPSNDKLIFNMSFQKIVKPYLVVLSNTYSPFNPPFGKIEENKNVIEIQGIQDRVIPFPVNEDNYVKIAGAKNNKVLLFSYPIKGQISFMQDQTGKLEIFDIDTKTKELFLDNVKDFTVYQSKILVVLKDSIRLFDVTQKPDLTQQGRKGGIINVSRVKVYVEPEKEWKQMLRETWKLMKQNYWNEKELKDWDEMLKKYEPLLDRVSTRYELGDVIQELQGETRTSHSYHTPYSYDTNEPIQIGGLGAEFEYDEKENCFRIMKIYSGDPINENEKSPLRDPGVQLEEGDCITSIDNEPITWRHINYYLLNKDQVTLQVLTKNGNRTVYVKLLKDEKFLIYRNWVEENRRYVHEKTQGKIGYVHIPDMMYQGFTEFFRLFISEFDKEGLIVDARFNRGGFISGLITQRLLLRRVGYVIPRNGKPEPEPYLSSPDLMVEVVNEYAGSDGDIFTYLFKKYKLGPVIGKRTWGGVIGISGRHRLADKTLVTQPEFAVHYDDIGLGIENHGVEPDIEVDIPPGEKGDPQLDKAIEVILKKLK